MAINPLIALQTQTPDLAGAVQQGRAFKESIANSQMNRQQAAQELEINEETLKALKEDRRIRSIYQGAAVALPMLESGDVQGLVSFAQNRIREIESQGRDASDSRRLLQKVQAGDIEGARRDLQQAVQMGQLSGILPSPKGPKYSNLKRTADGQLVGLNESTGQIEALPLPDSMTLADSSQKIEVNVDKSEQAGMTQEQKKLGDLRVERLSDLQAKALAAEEQNVGLGQLENMDVKTGFGEEAKSEISRVINALGGNGAALTGVDPANVQAFNQITGGLVLSVMQSQKGPQTEKDQERIAKTLPQISNESLANKFNLASLKALNFRRIEMAGFYENFLEENGTLKGADKAWSEYKQKTPLLSDNIKNPQTGLPMFFHEFKEKLIERNPTATEQQAINAWRELAN